ncbi:MAG: hypothetical protein WAN93_06015 [Solirubrobacteraceae bacterium]
MAAKDRIGKASEAVRSSDYLKRLIEDEQLRENLLAAYGSARSAYGRVNNGKPAGKALLEDRKLQRELAEAATALRDASYAIREPASKSKRKGGLGRALLLVIVGAVLAVALSESLRSKALDLLFGAEEEFDYSSTTMPAQSAPAAASAPAA